MVCAKPVAVEVQVPQRQRNECLGRERREQALPARDNDHVEEIAMNWDVIKGSWKELKGEVRSKWAKLTDDDIDQIAGKKDELIGRLQQRYGYAQDEAEREADSFVTANRSRDTTGAAGTSGKM